MGCDSRWILLVLRAETISIHAARVGCDSEEPRTEVKITISIHAARVGCDFFAGLATLLAFLFQSTQPEWAATREKLKTSNITIFQSTQPEWAATKGPGSH